MSVEIMVELLDEGVPCWRPVLAVQMEGGTFRIPSDMVVPEDETWAFAPGDNVACEERAFQGGARRLVAIRKLESAG